MATLASWRLDTRPQRERERAYQRDEENDEEAEAVPQEVTPAGEFTLRGRVEVFGDTESTGDKMVEANPNRRQTVSRGAERSTSCAVEASTVFLINKTLDSRCV